MTYNLIRRAIFEKQSLSAVYEDYIRHFSPHAIGTSRANLPAVVAFQYGGGRLGGLPISGDWVVFEIQGLIGLRLNGDTWVAGFPATRPLSALSSLDLSTSTP